MGLTKTSKRLGMKAQYSGDEVTIIRDRYNSGNDAWFTEIELPNGKMTIVASNLLEDVDEIPRRKRVPKQEHPTLFDLEPSTRRDG